MDLAFGGHVLDLARRELRRGDKLIELEPQVFDLLAYLVRHRDRVVSKDDLLQGVWGGRIVSDSAMTVRINAARKALGDSGESQHFIRTMPRKGFRFIAEVEELVRPQAPVPSEHPRSALQPPHRPSIAVLPFENLSGDPEQGYFVDGMAEEIITALARVRWLFVSARNSSFVYGHKPIDVRQVGRELGVAYVLEGSVRRVAEQVRITAQLIDASNGSHLWASRFDSVLESVFELQDHVAAAVVGQVQPEVRSYEIKRANRKPTENLEAYELYLRALGEFHMHKAEATRRAISLLQEALAREPRYASAAAMLCECRVIMAVQGWAPVSTEERAEAVELARQAIHDGKDDSDALCWASFGLLVFAHEIEAAATAVERSLLLNPCNAHAWDAKGWVAFSESNFFVAIDAFQNALRLSPFDPFGGYFRSGLALAHLGIKEFNEAARWASASLFDFMDYPSSLRVKTAANAHLGRLDDARRTLDRLLRLQPGMTIRKWRERATSVPEVQEILESGLRRAGLPEG